jgi:uncharacterized membrane protein
MSEAMTFVIVAAVDLFGFLCFSYVSWKANQLGHLIAVGEVGGKSVPSAYRAIMLYQHWISWVLMAIASVVLIAIANLKVVQVEPNAGPIAHFAIFACGIAVFSWLAHGTREFLYLRSLLRADPSSSSETLCDSDR